MKAAPWKAAVPILAILLLGSACRQEAKGEKTTPPQGPTSAWALARPQQGHPGLENFAKISEALYRGAQPRREGFAELKRLGVRTVVNLRDHHSDAQALAGLGLRYAAIPCETSEPTEAHVVAFLRVVTDPANQPVFVHCRLGADRTGMMVACYRMTVQGWDRQAAVSEMYNFGFHPIWQSILKFLGAFDPKTAGQFLQGGQAPPVQVVP